MDELIELRQLSIGYPGRKAKAVYTDINACAEAGSLIALMGANGVGKSTLLRTLAGLQPALSGEIRLLGRDIKQLSSRTLAKYIAFVPSYLLRAQRLKVIDMVSSGRFPYSNWIGREDARGKAVVRQAIQRVGIEHLTMRDSSGLSDGEYHRAALARAIVQESPLIILDEPLAFLDIPNKYATMQLLKELAQKEKKCILFSSHDLNLAIEYSRQLWMMTSQGFRVSPCRGIDPEQLLAALF